MVSQRMCISMLYRQCVWSVPKFQEFFVEQGIALTGYTSVARVRLHGHSLRAPRKAYCVDQQQRTSIVMWVKLQTTSALKKQNQPAGRNGCRRFP